MIYLDHSATSFPKPNSVCRAMVGAICSCANPGRGGYPAAMHAASVIYNCREIASEMFDIEPENVVFTSNCTHGLNIAIRTLVKPGSRVVVSGFEHNAVMRPLYAIGADVIVAGQRLFDRVDTISSFDQALRCGVDAAIFTHVSNVFGYILPVKELSDLCIKYGVPFLIDAAQSAGVYPVSMQELNADFIAMPGHKGLLGPQGTGLLLCKECPDPIIYGGTGSNSNSRSMPEFLPDRLEAGTVNVPGISGLSKGMSYLMNVNIENIAKKEECQAIKCIEFLKDSGIRVFSGNEQSGTFSFVPSSDCELFADKLANAGISVRAGLHCAPLAHSSAGTLDTGTVRVSFGYNASDFQSYKFIDAVSRVVGEIKKI